jgi:phosphoglycolate phosphatase
VRPAGIVFDLDGTLVDSRLDLAAAVNATRELLGLPPLALDAVTAMIGEGARSLVRRALPREVDGEAFEAAYTVFREAYWEVCLDATTVYPGVLDAVASLAVRLPLAVLTNKPERESRRILEGLGLAPYFETLVGGDTLATRKPDPAGLRSIAQRWGVAAPRLVLVGDSKVDVDTAVAAGASLALVSWGFGHSADLVRAIGRRIGSPGDLAALVEQAH